VRTPVSVMATVLPSRPRLYPVCGGLDLVELPFGDGAARFSRGMIRSMT